MTYKTHIVGGIILATIPLMQGLEMQPLETLGYYSLSILGALLPDIDHPKSVVSKYSFGINRLFKKCKHRGVTHTLLAVFVLQCFVSMLMQGSEVSWGIGIGYMSHLMLDYLNPRGIPVLYPLSKRNYRIGHIKTDGQGEFILLGMLFVLGLYFLQQLIMP